MLLVGAAFVIVTTALYHSILGERRVISALLAMDSRALSQRARRALRFTWHSSAVFMLMTAAAIAWPGTPLALIRAIGLAYLFLGMAAFWVSRGKHVAGPLFSAAGVLAMAGTF